MTLDELIGSGAITSVVHRASEAGPGALFCALPGLRADGHDFVAEAASRGAAAAVVEREVPGVAIPQVVVPDARLAMALAAAAVAGHPSRDLVVVGVTGTNGKTTSAFLVHAVLEAAGHRAGRVGTIEARAGGAVIPVAHTTPDAVELKALFARMRDAGDTACAMEVSSHALDQRRVAGTRFAAALVTNLTRDHLDYHPDVESYFAAKRRLFARPPEEGPDPPGASNLDDGFGRRLAAETGALGYAVDADAPVRPARATGLETGIAATVDTPRGPVEIASRLRGRFNLANICGVVAVGELLGLPHEAVAAGIGAVFQAEGLHVPHAAQALDMRAELAVRREQPDHLGRDVAAARIGCVGVRVGQEVGEGGDQVEQDHHDAARHRQPVPAEAPPDQPGLAGGSEVLFGPGARPCGRRAHLNPSGGGCGGRSTSARGPR